MWTLTTDVGERKNITLYVSPTANCSRHQEEPVTVSPLFYYNNDQKNCLILNLLNSFLLRNQIINV